MVAIGRTRDASRSPLRRDGGGDDMVGVDFPNNSQTAAGSSLGVADDVSKEVAKAFAKQQGEIISKTCPRASAGGSTPP